MLRNLKYIISTKVFDFWTFAILHSSYSRLVTKWLYHCSDNIFYIASSSYKMKHDLHRTCRLVAIAGAISTLRSRQNGHDFADGNFKCMCLNENTQIAIKISLKCVPKDLIDNIPASVQIMAWRRPNDKPLSERMLVSLLTHICVTQPQCINLVAWQLSLCNSFEVRVRVDEIYRCLTLNRLLRLDLKIRHRDSSTSNGHQSVTYPIFCTGHIFSEVHSKWITVFLYIIFCCCSVLWKHVVIIALYIV